MKLSLDERNTVLDAACDYGLSRYDDFGSALSIENTTTDTFRVQLVPGHCMTTVVLLDATFDSVESALTYFNPARQLSLFDVSR